MKPSIETKALAACRDLVACRAEVERLGHLIGDALNRCLTIDGVHEPHLKDAYGAMTCDDEVYYHDEAEILAILAICPYCTAAHHAIQERKLARRKLGAARRAVTMIGRTKPSMVQP